MTASTPHRSTAATPRALVRQRMTDKFAPASAANSGEAAAGICTGYFPAAASLLFTRRVMLAFSKQSKLMNLAQQNSVFFSPISLAFTKEMGNKDYVHFFDTRQRNEPKKTCIGGEPPYVPPDFARYAKKHSLFCQITRGCCKVQTLLSPFKENGENRGQPTGCHIYFYTNCSKYRTAKVQLYLTTHRKEPTP